MIRVSRYSKDENGNLIKPSDDWKKKAKNEMKNAIKEKKSHKVNSNIYAHREVRIALEKLFKDKCAYCETKLTPGFDWEVEHYRPKAKVAERPDHPGYYWLIYKWDNLFPVCTHCNQYRIDKPRWKEEIKNRGGKSTHFPLKSEKNRAMDHLANLKLEEPLLLNPCNDYPEKHLSYNIAGEIQPLNNSKKGLKTIKIYNLKRSRLRDDREQVLLSLKNFLELRDALKNKGQINFAKDLDDLIKKNYLMGKCIYAGLSRYVYKFPWIFGV